MKRRGILGMVLAGTTAVVLAILSFGQAQQVHRNGFEARTTVWQKGAGDAPFTESAHDITEETAHTGQFSEHIQFTAETGNAIHYYYATGRAPIAEELSTSLWIKSTRPGVQLLARVVLPKERNPQSLDEPMTTLIRGDSYQLAGRWQRLELRQPVKLVREQQQFMRLELKRDVDFTDAYIDRLMLNVYGGPGVTDVWIDDLEIGPVLDAPSGPFQTTSRPVGKTDTGTPRPGDTGTPALPGSPRPLVPATPNRAAIVELSQDHLMVSGKRFFFRGIRHSDTPLKALRDAGFNTVWFDFSTPPAQMTEAINLGFWLVPSLPVTANEPRLANADGIGGEVSRFLEGDAVLFWDLGGGLAQEQANAVNQAARVVRAADPQRPIAADVWDGFLPYSRNLDLLGIHRWPLMTALELPQYHAWLTQRRQLARPGTFMWTWVQTHLPDWYASLVYDRPGSAGFDDPIGPQPEQIRLLTYAALAAGCRGLGFWSDRYLADTHQGRDRLLVLALLNQELQMLEPLLVSQLEAPTWIDTSIPEVKATVMRTERGLLVVPIWMGRWSQFVPGQAAIGKDKLSMVVPQVPAGCQAWEVSPGDVRSLKTERVVGGTRVTLPEFGLTTAVVFTSDNGPTGLLVRFQDQTRRLRRIAAQWAHDLAEVELEKVMKVQAQLERMGRVAPDAKALENDARARLRTCVDHYNSGDFREAYLEAQRAVRPLRILMRAEWEEAIRGLDSPVACPYAVSFYTLPRQWDFIQQVRQAMPGANVLPNGDFELTPDRTPESWTAQEITLDEVSLEARRVTDDPKEGRQCLKLEIKPKTTTTPDGKPIPPPMALERTFLAINSPAVKLDAGSWVRISGWIKIPKPITASADGVLFYDSAGGEPLAVRLTSVPRWQRFTLYRQVPASGLMSVTLALTGIGTAYFDDVRIEPLLPPATAAAAAASLPRN